MSQSNASDIDRRPDVEIPAMVSQSDQCASTQERKLLQKALGQYYDSDRSKGDLAVDFEEPCCRIAGSAALHRSSRPEMASLLSPLTARTVVVVSCPGPAYHSNMTWFRSV